MLYGSFKIEKAKAAGIFIALLLELSQQCFTAHTYFQNAIVLWINCTQHLVKWVYDDWTFVVL